MAVTTEKKSELVVKFGRDARDTGKAEVQIALLTERIMGLTDHAKLSPEGSQLQEGAAYDGWSEKKASRLPEGPRDREITGPLWENWVFADNCRARCPDISGNRK